MKITIELNREELMKGIDAGTLKALAESIAPSETAPVVSAITSAEPPTEVKAKTTSRTTARTKTETPPVVTEAPTVETAPVEIAEEAPPVETKPAAPVVTLTHDDIKAKAMAVRDALNAKRGDGTGMQDVNAIIKSFSVTKLTELKTEDFEAVMAKLEGALNG